LSHTGHKPTMTLNWKGHTMQPANCPNLHRKFIAFVLAASIAITGFSAAPARADEDFAKIVAGLAVLGILGAAINKDRHRRGTVTRLGNDPVLLPVPRGTRPLPPQVTRYDLPRGCVRYYPEFRDGRKLMGQRCLRKHYRHLTSLPQQCRVTFWDGRRHKNAFKPRCLRRNGYRIVHR